MKFLNNFLLLTGFLVIGLGFAACNDDDDDGNGAHLSIEVTDAPIDDPQVETVVVTVAEIWVDGEMMENFQKQSVDLLQYQQGETNLLFSTEVEAGNYQRITLVLDGETDESGDTPGTYIALSGGERIAIKEDRLELDINKSFEVVEGSNNRMVIDFSLRKIIEHNQSGTPAYSWDSETEIESGLRLVNHIHSGTISGSCTDLLTQSDKIIVYAYTQGSFDMNEEMQSEHGENFAKAVTSTAVNASGQYTLAFLEEGTYELHFASYKDLDEDGRLELTGMLAIKSILGPAFDAVTVESGAEVALNIQVTGLLPI